MSEPEIPWWANQLGAKSIRITELEAEVGTERDAKRFYMAEVERLRAYHRDTLRISMYKTDCIDAALELVVHDRECLSLNGMACDCFHDELRAALTGADE